MQTLSMHCRLLRCLNVNGCDFITDTGMCALARRCDKLQEVIWAFVVLLLVIKQVRMRGTRATDRCLQAMAINCPDLQWISHADITNMPRFSPEALQALRDACTQRLIC
jgi:hypothetical protein